MEKFIEVTCANDNRKAFINVSRIFAVEENDDGTADISVGLYPFRKDYQEFCFSTAESYSEVVDKISSKHSPYSERGPRLIGFEIIIPVSELKVDIESALKELEVDIGVYILHDKDNKEPHYHIIVPNNCGGIRLPDLVTAFRLTNDNSVTYVKGFSDDIYNCLIHNKPSLKDRYQYSVTDIHYYEKK